MTKKTRFIYLSFDILASLIVWVLLYLYRQYINDYAINDILTLNILSNNYLLHSIFAFPLISIPIHYLSGFYNTKNKRSRIVDLFTTTIATMFISLAIYFTIFIDDIAADYTFYYKSFFILWLAYFIVTYIFRIVQTTLIIRRLRTRKTEYNQIIIGTGECAKKVTLALQRKNKKNGSLLLGYISATDEVKIKPEMILGDLSQLEKIVVEKNIKDVVIAMDDMNNDTIYSIANRLMKYDIEIRFSVRLFEVVTGKKIYLDFEEPIADITSSTMPAWQQSFKRTFDIIVSATLITILSPLMLYVALRVKRESKGNVFFRQKRVGVGGKEFNMYKFRTMYSDAEKLGPQLSSVDDNRITPFGKTMRKFRLDEIPQFWNILVGDMSIVGPRPERQFYIKQIEEIAPYYCLVYSVQPGLFSWGPIKVGYCDTVDKMVERLRYDLIYINNMSILNDIKILFYSIEIVLKGKGQ
ncbi:MAG: sugar transferase [bacterium]